MSRSNDEEKDQLQPGRRKFLRIGTLGAAALAAGATGQAKVAPETEMPGQAGQTPPAQAPPAQGQAGAGTSRAAGRPHGSNGISIRCRRPSRR